MAERILEIVAARGKMHNPETDSGGVLLGTVAAVGERFGSPPPIGERIVTLASLTLTPLRLERSPARPRLAQVEVAGTAYVCDRAPLGAGARRPAARDRARGLRRLRRRLAHPRAGAARRARSACSAPGTPASWRWPPRREAMAGGTLVAVDVDRGRGRAGRGGSGSATSPSPPTCATRSRALEALRAAGAPPADLTVVVVNATGCEPTAILLTADGRDGPLLLDGDQLLGRRAGRGRDRLGRADAGRQRLRARPRRLRARPRPRAPRRCARRWARRSRRRRERGLRAPGADALARPRRARPRQPHRRAHLPRGGPRRVPRRARDRARRVRRRPLLGQLQRRDRPGVRLGDGAVRGPRAGPLEHDARASASSTTAARSWSRPSSGSCSGIRPSASRGRSPTRSARRWRAREEVTG